MIVLIEASFRFGFFQRICQLTSDTTLGVYDLISLRSSRKRRKITIYGH